MNKHKYLEEIGEKHFAERTITDIYDRRYTLTHPFKIIKEVISSKRNYRKSLKKYGFNIKETWSLDASFYFWLYERLRGYLDVASDVVDLSYYKFNYGGEQHTQESLIRLLVSKLETMIKLHNEAGSKLGLGVHLMNEEELIKEICDIWCILLPVMWW